MENRFRAMRRNKQELTKQECEEILKKGTAGVLAVEGDGGYPYAVPMSYVYTGKNILFHSALEGHKVDALRRNEKASFCVIDKDQVMPREFTTYYRSVIVFGKVRIWEKEEQLRAGADALAQKYGPNTLEERKTAIDRWVSHMRMFVFEIEHMTGKQAKELGKEEK